MTEHATIGFIADDITGATDQASALAVRGLSARVVFADDTPISADTDAVVVARKIRSIPADEACRSALQAAAALRAAGATRLFSKYCSTFDSTADGNIGPIADALLDATGARLVVHCPAYPANKRTVYLGYLFVGDELLSESPMRNHPLNPMTDAQLLRVLGAQTDRDVGLLPLTTIDGGTDAVTRHLAQLEAAGVRHVIADAIHAPDLETIAATAATGAVAAGSAAFGAAFAAAALRRPLGTGADPERARLPEGPAAMLAGSMSQATRQQVAEFGDGALTLSVAEMVDGDAALERAAALMGGGTDSEPILISTDFDPASPRGAAEGMAHDEVARSIERTMGRLATELVRLGVRRLIVAGGETSGAVADALALQSARMGPDISVGVPWMVADDRELAVAFKSGNFGGPTFFRDALEVADR